MNLPTYQTNLGESVVLTQANAVLNQYGKVGADANWTTVFESTKDADCPSIQQYNIQTWLGAYTLPGGEITERKLAILGRLQWGIGGVTMWADFDWKLGNQLSVSASWVTVLAAFSETDDAPSEVQLKAGYSSGGRAARCQATRSYPQLLVEGDGEGATAVVLFPIPPMAHALNLFATDPEFYEADAVSIRFVGGASAGVSAVSTDLASFVSDGVPFLDALANEDGVRFPESAKFVEISTTASEEYLVTPCFTLNL